MTDDQINELFDNAMVALDEKQDALERQFGIGGTLGNGVWLWGWANSKLPDAVRLASEDMKSFAGVTGLSIFAEPSWKGVEEQAWMLTALACGHFGGGGANPSSMRC